MIAVLGVGVGTAQGSISTAIVVDDSTASGNPLTVWGHLQSRQRDCLARRTVVFFEDFSSGPSKMLGRDQSSRNGIWVVQGDVSERAVGLHVRAASKTLGRGRDRRTCAAASKSFSF